MDFRPGSVQRVDERGGLRSGRGLPKEEEDLSEDPNWWGDHSWRAEGQEAQQHQEEEALPVALPDTSPTGEQEEEHQKGVCNQNDVFAAESAAPVVSMT